MKYGIVFAFLWACPTLSLAMSADIRTSIFPIVWQQRYLQDQNSELYYQTIAPTWAARLTFERYQLGIEGGSWSTTSGTTLINYSEDFNEMNTTHLFKMGSTYEWLHFYSGLGLGVYESELTNLFNGVSSKTKSGQIVFASGIFSVQAIFWYVHAITDLKLIFAKDYRPQPTPDLSFKLGVTF